MPLLTRLILRSILIILCFNPTSFKICCRYPLRFAPFPLKCPSFVFLDSLLGHWLKDYRPPNVQGLMTCFNYYLCLYLIICKLFEGSFFLPLDPVYPGGLSMSLTDINSFWAIGLSVGCTCLSHFPCLPLSYSNLGFYFWPCYISSRPFICPYSLIYVADAVTCPWFYLSLSLTIAQLISLSPAAAAFATSGHDSWVAGSRLAHP